MNISGVRSKPAKLLNSALCILHSAFAKLRLALVGLDGLEPSTSRLSGARSNHLSYKPFSSIPFVPSHPPVSLSGGGDDGIRTHDPLLAGQVLSQLSYTPIPWAKFQRSIRSRGLILVN